MKIGGGILYIGVLLSVFNSSTFASKPEPQRSLDHCLKLLAATESRGSDFISNSTLLPLNQLLGTRYCKQIAKNHIYGDIHSKAITGEGLAYLFSTTKEAADELIERMGVKALRPQYQKHDLVGGAVETRRLMLEDQPEFIREAVLLRAGVYTVAPILKRVRKAGDGKPPMYVPITVKGHQELERFDVLSTVFSAWALGYYLGETPDTGFVYLKPMMKVRTQRFDPLAADEMYRVAIGSDIGSIEYLVKDYLNTIGDKEKLEEIKPRRCSFCNICAWAPLCKSLMKENGDLSMMPYPPKPIVGKRLEDLDIKEMEDLAALDIHSPDFIRSSIKLGIPTERLKYWIEHAKSIVSDEPLLIKSFRNPFEDVSYLVHIDMEDHVDVYLTGVKIEKIKGAGKDRIVWKKPVWAEPIPEEKINPKKKSDGLKDFLDIEKGWAELLDILKTHPLLKSKDYKITVYSPHEIVKLQQFFDMVVDEPEWFSREQKSSKYYSEFENKGKIIDPDTNPNAGKEAKKLGRLIRNKAFFKKYPQFKPEDIFDFMDRSVDLLDYTRWSMAFPTYTNSIKKILSYVADELGVHQEAYLPGQDGLATIPWVMEYIRTGELRNKNRITDYNDIDTDADVFIARLIRRLADTRVSKSLRFAENFTEIPKSKTLSIQNEVDEAAADRARIYRLEEREKILFELLGEPLDKIGKADREQLALILDRGQYYAERQEIDEDKSLDAKEQEEKLQRLEFRQEISRKTKLIKFIKSWRGIEPDQDLPEFVQDKVAELFLMYPNNYLVPSHLNEILILKWLKPYAEKAHLLLPSDPVRRLKPPKIWDQIFDDAFKSKDWKNIRDVYQWGTAQKVWRGLYYKKAFGGD